MTPSEFPQMNRTYAKDQEQYATMPAHVDQDGVVTACWKACFMERVTFLFTGRLWVQLMTFGARLQPSKPSVICPLEEQKDESNNT